MKKNDFPMSIQFAHAIGDEVTIKEIEARARVTQLLQSTLGTQYEVVYWNNGERKTAWVFEWEIESK